MRQALAALALVAASLATAAVADAADGEIEVSSPVPSGEIEVSGTPGA